MSLPETGFLRMKQIIGDRKAVPPVVGIIPISESSWLNGCRDGLYPKGVKLGLRCTAWRVEDIRQLVAKLGVQS